MNTSTLIKTPVMLLVTALVIAVYLYGYVEQVNENNRSISTYVAEN